MFEIPDLVRTIMDFLPDIRVLQINRELDRLTRAHPEHALWQKCDNIEQLYAQGTVNMIRTFPLRLDCVAAAVNNVPVLKCLIDAGAPLDGMFEVACEVGNVDAVKLLDESGAVWDGDSIDCAALHGHTAVIEYICRVRHPRTIFSVHAMYFAASNGHLSTVEYLFAHKFSTLNVMFAAARNGHLHVVKFLIECGLDCPVEIMEEAASNDRLSVVKYIHTRFKYCAKTSLAVARCCGSQSVAEYLCGKTCALTV